MNNYISCSNSNNIMSYIFHDSTSFIHNQVHYLLMTHQPIINLIFESDYIDRFDIYTYLFKNHHLFQQYSYPKIYEIQIMCHPNFLKFLGLNRKGRL
jgi:hypothetical protein